MSDTLQQDNIQENTPETTAAPKETAVFATLTDLKEGAQTVSKPASNDVENTSAESTVPVEPATSTDGSNPDGAKNPFQKGPAAEEKSQAAESIRASIISDREAFSPEMEIARKITEEHITEYLEGSREDRRQAFKERREKRLLTAFEIVAALGFVVAIVVFLKNEPAVLVNILYIIAALAALWFWKKKNNKEDD